MTSSCSLPKSRLKAWRELEGDVKFKDPPMPLERYLGVYFTRYVKDDGTIVMFTSMQRYLEDAVACYMKEVGVTSLPFVATPYLDEVFTDKDPEYLS